MESIDQILGNPQSETEAEKRKRLKQQLEWLRNGRRGPRPESPKPIKPKGKPVPKKKPPLQDENFMKRVIEDLLPEIKPNPKPQRVRRTAFLEAFQKTLAYLAGENGGKTVVLNCNAILRLVEKNYYIKRSRATFWRAVEYFERFGYIKVDKRIVRNKNGKFRGTKSVATLTDKFFRFVAGLYKGVKKIFKRLKRAQEIYRASLREAKLEKVAKKHGGYDSPEVIRKFVNELGKPARGSPVPA